jgi:hypothetical protein
MLIYNLDAHAGRMEEKIRERERRRERCEDVRFLILVNLACGACPL